MLSLLKLDQNFYKIKFHHNNILKKFVHSKVFKNGSTIAELIDELHCIMGVGKSYKPNAGSKVDSSVKKYYASLQDQLPGRFVKDSFLYAFIPLSTSNFLQEKYRSIFGNVRYGRLMEDADIFAVAVLQKHILNPHIPKEIPSPYRIVTRMVFSTQVTDYVPSPEKDIKISGHVMYVGKSSSIVIVWLEQLDENNKWNKLLQANFLMASREYNLESAAIINSLKSFDSRECKVLEEGNKMHQMIQKWQEQSLTRRLPKPEEQKIIHNLFMESCGYRYCYSDSLPENMKWMRDCTLSSIILSLPEDRNMYNVVFGGFLMRHAIELGTSLSFVHGSTNSKLIGMNKIDFKKAISVGAIIQMHATLVYASNEYFQITVSADTVHKVKKVYTTNLFYLTFKLLSNRQLSQVVPYTYQESLMFIDGLRHFNSIMEKRNCTS